ncbi:MAG: hypothetical protein H6978_12120 [Gammaproteobacteria bacterium]|nr:hypothetical protein [Gammaproteobacteria bacterium]
MAHVMFCWEYGANLGHLLIHSPLIRALLDDGHQVSFAASRADALAAAFEDLPINKVIAPPLKFTRATSRSNVVSLAEILLDCGCAEVNVLRERVDGWREILTAQAPDLLIHDYSPAAMVANLGSHRPGITVGSGFFVPPLQRPVPPLRYWQPVDRARLVHAEQQLVDNINAVMAAEGGRLEALADLFDSTACVLYSFPELDHYGRPPEGYRWTGAFADSVGCVEPRWPAGDSPRVVGYLRQSPVSVQVLERLVASGCRLVVYAPDMAADLPLFTSPKVVRTTAPIDLVEAGKVADLAVSNANFNTVTALLAAGVPQLLLPTSVERYLVARRVELLGAGLAIPGSNIARVDERIYALLNRPEFRRNARSFADRYSAWTRDRQVNQMRELVADLLVRH